ncbi:MAG: serine/threonine protein kinase [Gemmatimonadetes bacterium]|nr:serine/threonine protein kinase [Gemmatimonadota bacterium]
MSSRIRAALAGRYVLERELGRGSTAVVHAARDLKHGRRVALKVIEPDVVSTLGKARFLHEIRTTAGLNHPHILPLFDSGDAAGYLYYTMPLVEGESLRARLDRAGPLPLSAALPLVRQLSDALAYAHSAGVVHRDLKPENILISGQDHVWIADFGLARALASATDHRLTGTGTAIGSPHYMSPEQASGKDDVDPRSDIYSLGCMVFEMLCGETPFTAGSVPALLARHISEPAPAIRDRCPDLPATVDGALRRAMSKDRSHRFRDVVEFTAALDETRAAASHAVTGPPQRRVRPRAARRRAWRIAAAVVAFAGVSAFVMTQSWSQTLAGWAESWWVQPALDSDVYVLFPLASESGEDAGDQTDLLHDALRQWSGLSVLAASELDIDEDVVAGAASNPEPALRAARRAGAGRLITGRVVRIADTERGRGAAAAWLDSVRVDLRLYDTARPGSPIRERSTWVPARGRSSSYRLLAENLLFETDMLTHAAAEGTTSYPARRLFNFAVHDVVAWQLLQADSQLAAAVDIDSNFAHAWLWLAQVRVWMGRPEAEWRYAAEHAHRRLNLLTGSDSLRADALSARAQGRIVDSCASYRQLTRVDRNDFGGWFGLGHCLLSDSVVIRDASSPSGWRFRADYPEALDAYRSAFRIQPSLHRAFRNRSYRGLQDLLRTRRSVLRTGRAAPPDTLSFRAYPTWQGDSLAFIPFPSNLTTPAWLDSASIDRAVYRQRRLFYDMATTWRIADRGNPEALEAVAVGLDLLGDPAGLDTLRKARPLARSATERTRMAASEVWLQLKYAIPDDAAAMTAARELADSLLTDASLMEADPGALSGLAALLGRVNLSIRLARHPRMLDAASLPPGSAAPIVSLFRFSAAAAPADSIRHYQERVDEILDRVDPETRRTIMSNWYVRSAGLALPSHRFDNFVSITPPNPLLRAQIAFVQADTAAVRAHLDTVAALRRARGIAPRDITLDAVVQEAWLLLRIGDAAAAMNLLRPTLDALSQMPLDLLMSDGMPSCLIRAMALRAEAARAQGDAVDAARWAAAAQLILARRELDFDPLFRR